MPIDKSNSRHRIRDQMPPEWIETILEEHGVFDRVLIVQSIRIKLGDAGRRDHHSFWESLFNNVKGKNERRIEGGCKPVVWRRGEAQDIHLR